MSLLLRAGILTLTAFAMAQTLRAQTPAAPGPPDHVALGIAAERALDPEAALRHYEMAVARDSSDYEANWRAAMALVDLGQQTPDSVRSARRDSLYAAAESYARRAVATDSGKADGHFALAVAVGRASLTKGKQERVRRAAEIRNEALKATAIDSSHAGAYHVLGRWHAEVMRLSGISRLMAKTFLGGGVLGKASWPEAIDNLERAVRLAPSRIYHRLELAAVYADRKRYAEARAELQKVDSLPTIHFMDLTYKKEAALLLRKISGKP
jgi:tetratricopeptide (TPR) repeat protein